MKKKLRINENAIMMKIEEVIAPPYGEVLIFKNNKNGSTFDFRYTGLYQVIKKLDELTYEIEILKYSKLQREQPNLT